MAISGISSTTSAYQTQFQQLKKDFLALQTDLSSNDLSDAQQAYTTLTQDLQNISQAQSGQQTGASNQITTDLSAVGTALQSGDLTTAQSAFTTLTQDLLSAAQSRQQVLSGQQVQSGEQTYTSYGHHHHHHGDSSQTTGSTLATDLSAVGTALQSGDLTTAQSAFTTLMQDLAGTTENTAASGLSATTAVGSNVNISV